MLVYFIIALISITFAFVTEYEAKNQRLTIWKERLFVFLSFLPVFLVSALRYGIGTDYFYTYVPVFDKIKEGVQTHVEYGYYLINRIVQIFSGDVQWVFVITSFIFCYCMYYYIFKQSKQIAISVLLFFLTETYFFSFNVVRQAIATAFFLVAIPFIREKKIIPYYVLIGLATLFHETALIYVPIYFIGQIKLKPKHDLFAVALLSICFVLQPFIQDILVNFLSMTRFEWYLNSVYSTEGYPGVVLTVLIILIYLLFLVINRTDKVEKNHDFHIYKNIVFLMMLLLSVAPLIPNTYRVLMLFFPAMIVGLPNTLEGIKKKELKMFLYILFMAIIAYLFIKRSMILGYNEVIPYVSIFDKM